MSRHDLLSPCDAPDPWGPAFRVRPCRRPPRRRVCCRILHLVGELDIAATPSLLVATGNVLAPTVPDPAALDSAALDGASPGHVERPPGGLVLDLGALTFCDAAGLTGLLRAARLADAAGVRVSLTAPPHKVMRILAICGLQRSFSLHPTTGNRRSSR